MPTITKGADQTTNDPNAKTVNNWATNISAGPADEAGQTLNFIVSNDSNSLFSVQPTINPSGTLTYQAALGANGNATVTVQLHDTGGTANGGVDTSAAQMFIITVHALNNAPTLDAINSVTIDEDAAQQTINLSGITVGPSYKSYQNLTITATSSNTALIPNPTVSYTSPNTTGTLSFTPVADMNGSATITVTLTDGGETLGGGVNTFTRTFNVTVNAINDAPVNHVPGNQSAQLYVPIVFSAANGNLTFISDVDAGADTVQVTLKATNGTITLSGTTGLSFTTGDGAADTEMTFTGSITNGTYVNGRRVKARALKDGSLIQIGNSRFLFWLQNTEEWVVIKRNQIELTWGKTATTQRQGNGQANKKVAVSPSRPLICCDVRS